jgi:hypothetical protein
MKLLKTIISILVIVALLFGAYMYISKNKGEEGATSPVTQGDTGRQANPVASEVGKDLLNTLLQLRSLTLDEKIFANPLFAQLVDFTIQIEPQPIGRPNPFAPTSRR